MNLLQLIIIFLALAVCGAIAFIAWELTGEPRSRGEEDRGAPSRHGEPRPPEERGDRQR